MVESSVKDVLCNQELASLTNYSIVISFLNRLRLTSLPDFPEFNRKTVPGSEDVGRILAIRSVVHEIYSELIFLS